MTMRQVAGLLKAINKARLVEFHQSVLSYMASRNPKFPSLDEFLTASLNENNGEEKVFDENTDKVLEAHALKRLQENQAKGR